MTRAQKIQFIEETHPEIKFVTARHPSCNRLIIDIIVIDGEVMRFSRNSEAQKPAKQLVDELFNKILSGGDF